MPTEMLCRIISIGCSLTEPLHHLRMLMAPGAFRKIAVSDREDIGGSKRGTPVAVDEWMITGDTFGVAGRYPGFRIDGFANGPKHIRVGAERPRSASPERGIPCRRSRQTWTRFCCGTGQAIFLCPVGGQRRTVLEFDQSAQHHFGDRLSGCP